MGMIENISFTGNMQASILFLLETHFFILILKIYHNLMVHTETRQITGIILIVFLFLIRSIKKFLRVELSESQIWNSLMCQYLTQIVFLIL